MKKYLPYILGAAVLLALGILLFGGAGNSKRTLNERITLKQGDKIPYGFYTARALLPTVFPDAKVFSDKRAPGAWDSIAVKGSGQAVFLIGNLSASTSELETIREFVRQGNHVFFIGRYFSEEALLFFGFDENDLSAEEAPFGSDDSLGVSLSYPRFSDSTPFVYPGLRHANGFDSIYNAKSIVLGRGSSGTPNFLQFKIGAGSLYLHTAPLAFSNYFILHKNNVSYYQSALSVIPPGVNRVLWNEYFLFKKTAPAEQEPAWLSILFRYKSFRWGFLTALAVLLTYVVMEMRRRQRIIPVLPTSKNDSLDFVQTIGRLYCDQRNHADLVVKMSILFLDHVRTRYNLPTTVLDDQFISALSIKAAYPAADIRAIVERINMPTSGNNTGEQDLAQFHKKLEKFYQHT